MKSLQFFIASFALAMFTLRAPGQAGTLDPTFVAGDGPDFGQSYPEIYAIAVQPDGRILVSGTFTNWNHSGQAYLVRLLPNGAVDQTFSAAVSAPFSITAQGNKILVDVPELWRLNPNGSIDNSFQMVDRPGRTRVAPDGSLVRAGVMRFSGIAYLARWNADGIYDTNFNVELGTSRIARIDGFAIQPDGKVVISGNFQTPARFIARINTNGSVDNTFVSANFFTPPSTIALAPGGRFYVVESEKLWRLLPDGNFDTNFSFNNPYGAPSPFAVQPDSKVIIGFGVTSAFPHLRRLNADGTSDPTFVAGFTNSNESIMALARQLDGRVLVAGAFSSVQGAVRHYIARLLGDAPVLAAARNGPKLLLSWPAVYSSAALQARGDAGTGTWQNLSATTVVSNDVKTATITPSNSAQFYRLSL
jgi:uncharacterized delta-60 repeat protein